MTSDHTKVKQILLDIATKLSKKGPGWSTEGAVFQSARKKLRPQSVSEEQAILDAWHDLFRDGQLCLGLSLELPGAPFYHLAVRT